jgi:hypothetical protein
MRMKRFDYHWTAIRTGPCYKATRLPIVRNKKTFRFGQNKNKKTFRHHVSAMPATATREKHCFIRAEYLFISLSKVNKYLQLAVHYNLPIASTKPGSTEVSITGANASLTEPVCKPAQHHQSESRTIFLPATWQRVATEHICQSSEEAITASFQNYTPVNE